MSKWFAILALVATIALVPLSLTAQGQQIDLSAPHSVAGTVAMNAVLAGTAPGAPAGAAEALAYIPSPTAEKAAIDRMVELLAAASPENRDEFRRMFEDGGMQASFPQVMTAWGLDSNNLGDVISAFYAILWQVAHDHEATPAQIVAARDQLLPHLLARPNLLGAPAADKQDDAAYLSLLGVTILTGYFGHKQRDEPLLQDELEQSIFTGLAAQGLDLTDVELTDAGFSRRSQ